MFTLERLVEHGDIAADWGEALLPVSSAISAIGDFLEQEEAKGKIILPEPKNIWRAFKEPMHSVKVLIVGQDPYPTRGHAMGLAFSVAANVRPLPRSLQNIFRELQSDLGFAPAESGDLSSWAQQGVLLLNRALTVTEGAINAHAGKGWEAITARAITALADRDEPPVAVLWGAKAQTLEPLLSGCRCIKSPHPSPLSASRGFFGSKPFSRVNQLLQETGRVGIDWELQKSTKNTLF